MHERTIRFATAIVALLLCVAIIGEISAKAPQNLWIARMSVPMARMIVPVTGC